MLTRKKTSVTVAFALFLATVWIGIPHAWAAEEVVFVGPHWCIERFNAGTTDFRTKAGLTKSLVTPNITFDITYEDPVGSGFFHTTDGANRQARLEEALTYVSNVLNMEGTIEVRVEESLNVASGTLASAGSFYSTASGFTNGTAYSRLKNGTKPYINYPEIRVIVNFGYNWNTTTSAPTAGRFDFLTVMTHELTHGFGFVSLSGSTGASVINTNTYSVLDSMMVRMTGNKYMFTGTPPSFKGTAADLKSNDLGFIGANAFTYYNQGVMPGLYAPSTFNPGSSLAHFDTGQIVGGSVMEHAVSAGVAKRSYADVDIGALIDLGYPDAAEATPPGEGEGEGEGEVDVTVTVQLTDDDALVPVKSATILVSPTNDQFTGNVNGNYSFKIAETGTYKVSATASGYKAKQSGNFEVTSLITQVNVPLAMEPFPVAKVGVSPSSGSTYDFGEVNVGESLDAAFQVSNTGGGQVSGAALVSGTGFAVAGKSTYVLGAGVSTSVNVRFTPNADGAFSGSVTFSGGDNGPVTVTLTGTGKEEEEPEPPADDGGCGTIAARGPGNGTWGNLLTQALLAGMLIAVARRRRTA